MSAPPGSRWGARGYCFARLRLWATSRQKEKKAETEHEHGGHEDDSLGREER